MIRIATLVAACACLALPLAAEAGNHGKSYDVPRGASHWQPASNGEGVVRVYGGEASAPAPYRGGDFHGGLDVETRRERYDAPRTVDLYAEAWRDCSTTCVVTAGPPPGYDDRYEAAYRGDVYQDDVRFSPPRRDCRDDVVYETRRPVVTERRVIVREAPQYDRVYADSNSYSESRTYSESYDEDRYVSGGTAYVTQDDDDCPCRKGDGHSHHAHHRDHDDRRYDDSRDDDRSGHDVYFNRY